MNFTTLSSWGPGKTPLLMKRLLIWIPIITCVSATIQSLFNQFDIPYGPQLIFSLSSWGLTNGLIWQPLSYLFIQESPHGLSFFFFISLFFHMSLFWIVGTHLLEMITTKAFLTFCAIVGVFAGLMAIVCLSITGQHMMLTGITPLLLALLTVWSMTYPEIEIFIFFLVPIKIKWLVLAILGILLMTNLSEWNIPHLFINLWAVIIAYLYAVCVWQMHSPLSALNQVEITLISFAESITRHLTQWLGIKASTEKNIIDIQTGQELTDDETFVDAMLGKISKYGEQSLSWNESTRLKNISKRKSLHFKD